MIADTRKSDRHLSSFHVELARTGEASPDEREWIERHLQECRRCADLAATFESHRIEFGQRAAKVPPSIAVSARTMAPRRRRIAAFALAAVLPAAAAFALFVSARRSPDPEPATTAKGGASLTMVARRGERVFPVDERARLRPGDQVRFVVNHVQYRYLIVASIDGAGLANVYFPYNGTESAEIGRRDRFEVPGSIVIDASPGPERFFALLSSNTLQTIAVRRALDAIGRDGIGGIRDAQRLSVGADEQVSLLVEKDAQ
jgi:hypothetical protein